MDDYWLANEFNYMYILQLEHQPSPSVGRSHSCASANSIHFDLPTNSLSWNILNLKSNWRSESMDKMILRIIGSSIYYSFVGEGGSHRP